MTATNQIFIDLLNKLGEQMGIAIDWSNKNILPYFTDLCTRVREYEILKHSIVSILWIIVCIFITNAFIKGTKKVCQKNGAEVTADESLYIVILILFSLIGIVTIVEAPPFINEFLEWIFIPEKQILVYMKQLMG